MYGQISAIIYSVKRHTLKMRQRILIIFVITWVLAIAVIGIVAIKGRIDDSRSSAIQKNAVSLNVCKYQLQQSIDDINVTALDFAMNSRLSGLLSPGFHRYAEDVKKLYLNEVGRLVSDMSYRAIFRTGYSFILFTEDGRIYANPNSFLVEIQDSDRSAITSVPSIDDIDYPYMISENDVFAKEGIKAVYKRKVNSSSKSGGRGILAFTIPENMIRNAFSSISGQEWAVVASGGIILDSNNVKLIGQDSKSIYGIQVGESAANQSLYIIHDGDIISYIRDEKNNLTYVLTSPREVLLEPVKNIAITGLIIGLGLVVVLILFSWYLSRRFTYPLEKLGEVMQKAEDGDLNVRMNPDSDDEIGNIGQRFDNMIGKLSDSMDSIQKAEKEQRKAEMKIMELQLKPHFLYNTLSSIIWLANEGKKDEVIDITKTLASFYRVTLSDGHENIPIKREVGNVKNYATIQHYRYADKFRIVYDVDPETEDYLVPKLILQPLVENSINYGMKTKDTDDGLIEVIGKIQGQDIVFEVRDNGDDATEETIEQLNKNLENGTSGIGTSNVYGRIKSRYGEQYGLHYYRENGVTTARIIIPQEKGEEDEY